MLHYQVAYHLPKAGERMVFAEVLDFPGVMSQGFDLAGARQMIASALEEIAGLYLEQGRALPVPSAAPIEHPSADLIERMPLSIEVAAALP